MAKQRMRAAKPVPALRVERAAWAASAVEQRPIAQLVPYANNARTHSQSQIEQLTAAIATYGWTTPVLVDERGMILAGHGRVLAAKRLGFAEVPVMVARGWSEPQKRAYILADNKIAENAGWDKDLLALELSALAGLPEFNLADIGFSEAELNRLLDDPEREGYTDPDAAAGDSAAAAPVSRLGDLWRLGEHRLFCGDSTNPEHVAAVLGGELPHLMVTDPPYGINYDPSWRTDAAVSNQSIGGARAIGKVANDHRADWREAWALFQGDVAYVWHASGFANTVQASLAAVGFDMRSQIIWAKNKHVIGRGDYHFQHEPCWYAVRKGATGHWHGDRSQTTLWSIANAGGGDRLSEGVPATGHGTQKPIECMKRPIENNSKPGDAVYEPFSGSGTTIIAAEITGRRALAIELDPAYVDVAVRRWEAFTKKGAILAAGELTMAEAAALRSMPRAAE